MKINSVDKAIEILNCFSAEKSVLGVGEVGKITGFTPSTVSRLLSTLESRGVVEKAEGYGKYQLGYRIHLWGIVSQKKNNLVTIAKPFMENLRDKCDEEVSLYILSDKKRICLERIPSKHALAMVCSVGASFPLHAGASGRVLLAFIPEEKRKEIIENEPLERFTPQTITDPIQLEEMLKEIRNKGYGFSKEEREPGAYSVVAPIRNANNWVVASLCIAGPLSRLSDNKLKLYINNVLETAGEISKRIGYTNKEAI